MDFRSAGGSGYLVLLDQIPVKTRRVLGTGAHTRRSLSGTWYLTIYPLILDGYFVLEQMHVNTCQVLGSRADLSGTWDTDDDAADDHNDDDKDGAGGRMVALHCIG